MVAEVVKDALEDPERKHVFKLRCVPV